MESQTLPGYGQMLADKLRSNLKGAPKDLFLIVDINTIHKTLWKPHMTANIMPIMVYC